LTLRITSAETIEFGRLTLAGEGGFNVPEASITAGNSLGHWTIAGGQIRPTASAVSASYSGAPYTLTLAGGRVVNITCPANVKHVDTLAQCNAALNNEIIVSGSTIKVRAGNKGGELVNPGRPVGNGPLPVFTMEAANPNDKPTFTQFRTPFSHQHGSYTLRNLRFADPRLFPMSPTVALRAEAGPITVEGLDVSMSTVPSILDQGFFGENYCIDTGTGSFPVVIRGCDLHDCGWGIFVRGVTGSLIENNEIRRVFGDGISVRGGTNGLTIRNNRIHTFIGDADYRHSDAIQFTDGGAPISNVTIEGNIAFLGDFFANCQQSALTDREAQRVTITATTTLTTATHASRWIEIDRSGPAITVTLPPASDCPQESIWILPLNSNEGTGDLPFTVSGAAGGDVTVSEGDIRGGRSAFRSNGTIWVEYPTSHWVGTHYINANYTVKLRNAGNRLRIDASAGNITITLPDAATFVSSYLNRSNQLRDITFINLHRVDNSANTVTVVRSGSDTFSGQGTSGSSFTLPPRRSVEVAGEGNANWLVKSGRYDLEGIFGNPPTGGYDNIIIRGNIFWPNSAEGVSIENHQGRFRLYNNTFVTTYMPDANADGTVNGFDGAYPQGIAIKMQANPTVANTERFSANNFISTQGFWDNWEPRGGQPATFSKDNIVLNLNQATTAAGQNANIAALATYVQGSTFADWYPITVDDAIDAVLARPGGPLQGTFIGAVGTTRSNGYWDFVAGQKNPAAPEPVIP
jgi:hypothetical protein